LRLGGSWRGGSAVYGNEKPITIELYCILKLKAPFLSGDYAEALAAADKAKEMLWAAAGRIQSLDYFYYAALAVAALYEKASTDEQNRWHDLLTAHREQLREWAENYPPTFGDKHALVLAELARLERRDLDAMRLYEEAIRAAHENGFVQNEVVANELAAQFYQSVASKKWRIPTSVTRATAFFDGAHWARSNSSTSATLRSKSRPLCALPPRSAHRSNTLISRR
jgi:tetratricopeptide (TPR) repeat protein